MEKTMYGNSTRDIIEKGQAILQENIELHRTNMELRGRLKEARRECRMHMTREAEVRRLKIHESNRRQITLAACGLTMAVTLLLVAVAICWGGGYAG